MKVINNATVRFKTNIQKAENTDVKIGGSWVKVKRDTGNYWYPREDIKQIKQ